MNCKKWLILIFLSTAVVFADDDSVEAENRFSLPKVAATCTSQDFTAKCCASIDLKVVKKKEACAIFQTNRREKNVNVSFTLDDRPFGHSLFGSKTIPTCFRLHVAKAKLCLDVQEIQFAKKYAKFCSQFEVYIMSGVFHYPIPCLEYKNKKILIIRND